MMTTTRRSFFVPSLLLCCALGMATGCGKKNTKTDEQPVEQTDTTTTPEKSAAWQSAPAYEDLQLSESVPAIQELGENQGTFAYKVGELLVVHKPTPANKIVSAQLYYIGGSQRLSPETTGIEQLALKVAAQGGTQSTPRDAYNAKLDSMGASIGAFASRDDSGVAMKTILPYFNDTWELFIQSIFEPAMPEDVIELQRTQTLARIDSLFEDPDSQVGFLATQSLFEGHPYANIQLGTKEVVSQVSREELRGWQRALLQPEEMMLVVVGDVPKDDLLEKVQRSLGRLQQTREVLPALPSLTSGEPDLVFARRDIATNYVFGLFEAPALGNPDFAPMLLAAEYLSDRLFEEVRTKRNLTYAVSSGISGHRANYGYLYVTAVQPKETLQVIFDTVQELKQSPLTEQQLKETLNVYITNRYMGQETNSSQAAELAYSYIMTGDWKKSSTLIDTLKQVKPEDVQRVVNTYVNDIHFAVVGPDEAALPKELMNQ